IKNHKFGQMTLDAQYKTLSVQLLQYKKQTTSYIGKIYILTIDDVTIITPLFHIEVLYDIFMTN
ncbi:22189_t:CDS:2, partial [Entrophospora sp. SA101]